MRISMWCTPLLQASFLLLPSVLPVMNQTLTYISKWCSASKLLVVQLYRPFCDIRQTTSTFLQNESVIPEVALPPDLRLSC
jgi:hypothetical protein